MLESIRQNITKLIALYEGEKQRADDLSARLSASEEQNETYRKQITDLNRKIDNLKLTEALAAGGGNPAARERIEKLIREIDRCINLLEK